MTGSEVLEKTKKVADKMAMGLMNAIAGTSVSNSGSVTGVPIDVPRASKGGKCPPHLLGKPADKEADNESVATKEEVNGEKK